MNSAIPASTKFTPLQQELLRLYSRELPKEDLVAVKDMLGNYFLNKLQDAVDASVDRQNLTDADFEKWLNEKS